jgi:hypothetical protein
MDDEVHRWWDGTAWSALCLELSIGMKRTVPPHCGADRRKLPDGWSEASEPDVKQT